MAASGKILETLFESNLKRAPKRNTPFETDEIEKSTKKFSFMSDTDMPRPIHLQNQQDQCDLYTKLLATKLRTLNPKQLLIVTNKIDNLVFHAQMESSNSFHQNINSCSPSPEISTSSVPCYSANSFQTSTQRSSIFPDQSYL